MKKSILIGLLLLASSGLVHAASERITTKDTAIVGSGTVVNKKLNLDIGSGNSNPSLEYKTSDASLNLNKNVFRFGDGTSGDKILEADLGLGASNPKLKYDVGDSEWQFANDGSSFTAFGSGSGGTTYAWSGFHSSNCSWSATGGGSYVDPSIDSSCTFTQLLNKNFGSVTSHNDGTPGNNLPGIVFSPPVVGTYSVCAITEQQAGGTEGNLQLYDGTNVIATGGNRDIGSSGVNAMVSLCGVWDVASLTSKTLRIRLGGGSTSILTNGGATPIYVITWTIRFIGA